jgi:hypothetical protein
MSEDISEMAAMNSWSGLLEETRRALTALRTEDLEELSARAERMSDVTGFRRQQRPMLRPGEMVSVAKEHCLLGELLIATDRNYKFLQRLQGRRYGRALVGKRDLRWVL